MAIVLQKKSVRPSEKQNPHLISLWYNQFCDEIILLFSPLKIYHRNLYLKIWYASQHPILLLPFSFLLSLKKAEKTIDFRMERFTDSNQIFLDGFLMIADACVNLEQSGVQ